MFSTTAQIQALLAAERSAARDELITLGFTVLTRQPLSTFVDRGALLAGLERSFTREAVQLIAARHVLPALQRNAARWEGRPETVRDLLSAHGESELEAIVAGARWPRFHWLRGAIDPDDLRALIAPVVQQLLLQFTSRLPLPGFGGAGAPGSSVGGLGGLMGRIGKQVQRGAGQLADVGRSVFGGAIREFSETATSDFRKALAERLASPEGERLLVRMRQRFLAHVLATKVDEVVQDAMRLPLPAIAGLSATALAHQPELSMFRAMLAEELDAALGEVGARTPEELLSELGVYESTRAQVLAACDLGVRAIVRSDEFGAWLSRLLAGPQSEEPA